MYTVIHDGDEIGSYDTMQEANAAIVAFKSQGQTGEFSIRVTQ